MSSDQPLSPEQTVKIEKQQELLIHYLRNRVEEQRFEVTSRFLLLLLEDKQAQREFVETISSGQPPAMTDRMKELLLLADEQAKDDIKPMEEIIRKKKKQEGKRGSLAVGAAVATFIGGHVAFAPQPSSANKQPQATQQTDSLSTLDMVQIGALSVSVLGLITGVIAGTATFLTQRELKALEKAASRDGKRKIADSEPATLVAQYIDEVEPQVNDMLRTLQAGMTDSPSR